MDPWRLCDLKPGQQAQVISLHTDPGMRRRLMDIGLTPGTVVACVGRSPGGDPFAYRIRGAIIAIRASDGRNIRITTPEWIQGENGYEETV